jgi:DNA-binding response OmpR family regulator
MSVLISAPQPHIRRLLRDSLTNITAEIREASSGEAVWTLVQRQLTSLLITVWPLTDIDGSVLLRYMRTATRDNFPMCCCSAVLTARQSSYRG